MSTVPPVLIVKKKSGHRHNHHGGAWKVAYADFVTAMMAFFLVMWLVGQGEPVREGVAAYFRDPAAFDEGGRGVLPGAASSRHLSSASAAPDLDEAKATLERAAERMREKLQASGLLGRLKDQIEIRVTDEGLRIELLESPEDGFFDTGSATPKPQTVALLGVIGAELAQLQHRVAIEGHTDNRPYASTDGYSNWELSADRANSARRVLQRAGVRQEHIEAIRGYADTRPRLPDQPEHASNRRVSIVVRHEKAPGW